MAIDPVTFYTHQTAAAQYGGILKDATDKFLKRTEVVPEREEARVKRVLDEDIKTIQRIVGAEKRVIQTNEQRGYDAKGRLATSYEKGKLGNRIDILI